MCVRGLLRVRVSAVFLDGDGWVIDTAELDVEYWYRNLRETVQFEQACGGCWTRVTGRLSRLVPIRC